MFKAAVGSQQRRTLFFDTLHLSIGQGAKLLIQAIYFVLIARSLGPSSYGSFVAITALTGILGPFAGLGSANLFIKNVRSGKRTAAVCWGNGLVLTIATGLLFSVFLLGLNLLIGLKTSSFTLFWIAVSDLVFMRITDLAGFGFAAVGNMKQTAIQGFVMSALRLIGIGYLSSRYHAVTFMEWVYAYVLTGILGTLYAVWKASGVFGQPALNRLAAMEDMKEGFFFSLSTSAQSIYNDIDKTMLGRLATLADTGIYGAAYRFIDVAMTPVRSLISAAYPQFFRLGQDGGIQETYKYSRKLISRAVLYGVGIFAAIMLVSPFIPLVLGHRYDEVVPALRWLALIPLLRCVHSFLADALAGANMQAARAVIQVVIAVINIALNLVILPRWSWRGAAWTSLASDALLTLSFYVWIRIALHRAEASI